MRKVGLIIAMVAVIAGTSFIPDESAYGQSTAKLSPQPRYDVMVQDDSTNDYLLIELWSGNYKFIRCYDNLEMKGVGVVRGDGCVFTLTDITDTHKVLANVDLCGQQAKAYLEQTGDKETAEMKEALSDTDLKDNLADCDKPIIKK